MAEQTTTVMAESQLPTPRELAESFAMAFAGNATDLAYLFGGPLYLVGSILTSATPGDIDIRCVLSREDALLWFGEGFDAHDLVWPKAKHRMHREQLKQSRRHTERWRRGRIDFQFQVRPFDAEGLPIFEDDRPRIRLDQVPPDGFAAGRSKP